MKPTTLGDLQVRGEKDWRWINGESPARPATIQDLVFALGGLEGMLGLLVNEGVLKVVMRTHGLEHHVMYEVAER